MKNRWTVYGLIISAVLAGFGIMVQPSLITDIATSVIPTKDMQVELLERRIDATTSGEVPRDDSSELFVPIDRNSNSLLYFKGN